MALQGDLCLIGEQPVREMLREHLLLVPARGEDTRARDPGRRAVRRVDDLQRVAVVDVAHGLALDGDRDIDLPHAGLAHGVREIAGILHDMRVDLAEDLHRPALAELCRHRVEQVRGGVGRHEVRDADAGILLRKRLPGVGNVGVQRPEVIPVDAEDDGVVPDAHPVAVILAEGIRDHVAALRHVGRQEAAARCLTERLPVGQHHRGIRLLRRVRLRLHAVEHLCRGERHECHMDARAVLVRL